MEDTFEISVTLAATLLLQKGDVSISDIRALPFVRDQQEAFAIARRLSDSFGSRCRVEVPDSQGGANVRISMAIGDSSKGPLARSSARAMARRM
jgi:hypothetical protein